MEASDSNELPENRAQILRAELKKWEKEFSANNDNKKASRQDIRLNPEIAAKYKEYNKIRDAQSQNHVSHTSQVKRRPQPRAKKQKEDSPKTSDEHQERFQTPTKMRISKGKGEQYELTSASKDMFTPRKISLWPTPQKDGLVLGLFDLLGDNESSSLEFHDVIDQHSPRTTTSANMTLPKLSVKEDHTESKVKLTPVSSPTRRRLDAFSTPPKNSDDKVCHGMTPLSLSKFHFSTPSFLRRDRSILQRPFDLEENQDQPLSPQAIRVMKRKHPIRGLSSILADLREIQDENLDQELEALREMESEEMGIVNIPAVSTVLLDSKSNQIRSLSDDQRSSFDRVGEVGSSEDDKNAVTQSINGKPPLLDKVPEASPLVNVYKKKGQKRTTRMVKMKPTRPKLPPTVSVFGSRVNDYSSRISPNNSGMMIPFQNKVAMNCSNFDNDEQARNFDSDSQSEYTASEGETRYRRPSQRKKSKKASSTNVNKIGNFKECFVEEEREESRKTSIQRFGSLSHTNFRRLKLRNSGASGPLAAATNGRGKRFKRKKQ